MEKEYLSQFNNDLHKKIISYLFVLVKLKETNKKSKSQ